MDAADAGAHDSGGTDAGGMDAADTGAHDSGGHDSGGHDSGGEDAGLQPCTTTNPTHCVKCQGNTNNLCTQTEAVLVAHDIAKGIATAPGNDPDGGCYTCLVANSSIDTTVISGKECEDQGIHHGTPTECRAALSCMLDSHSQCAQSGGDPTACYCGGSATCSTSATCNANPSNANGDCAQQIAQGMGFSVSDGTDVCNNWFITPDYAASTAMVIMTNAGSFNCTACLQ
jgi:hypothetical protein